ncbi:hypothetical protein AAG747_27455 [Rapidithrix thailandica]|uniref:Uncharacterized protein n=1 Tax=Rapidithrix thailandica TaxID=413964 RepID=A0AAW9SGR3_9BACT
MFEDKKQPGAIKDNDEPTQVSLDSSTAIYRQFFFTGTHNSYSGNLNGMKREGIETQLREGLRFFEFDLFSYHTQTKLKTTWPEVVDEFMVFEYLGKTHLLTYSETTGILKIYLLNTDEPELLYENSDSPFVKGERSFSVLPIDANLYVLTSHGSNGELAIYRFDNHSLAFLHSEKRENTEMKLFAFVYEGEAYLTLQNQNAATFSIHNITLSENTALVSKALYETTSVPAGETFTPFVQNNTLYIFRHNNKSVTYFTVETLHTKAEKWTVKTRVKNSSGLLKGAVQTSFTTDGKLFINTYTSTGNVVGNQLVMDNEKPNLVNEYVNEVDMLAGARANIYPSTGGYYLMLQKEAKVQLSFIKIGELVLGHDAPGDEVDLDVDNPNSILLADWIQYIAEWSEEHPSHEPLFIMTELKEYEQWIADAKWQNIIRLMQENFGEKLRYHHSSGFQEESIVDQRKIVDGKTLYFMDESGDKEGGLLGKVILYIQPNNKITKSEYTGNFMPFETTSGKLQANFLQLKRYRENNKLVSPDWRKPENYGNDIGKHIDHKDNSYISRIFHMESSAGDSQYGNIQCTNVMFAVSDRPFDQGLYAEYVQQQKVKNELKNVPACE